MNLSKIKESIGNTYAYLDDDLDYLIENIEYLHEFRNTSTTDIEILEILEILEALAIHAVTENRISILIIIYKNFSTLVITHKILEIACEHNSLKCVIYLLRKFEIHNIHVNPYGAYTHEIKQLLENYVFLKQKNYEKTIKDLLIKIEKTKEWLSQRVSFVFTSNIELLKIRIEFSKLLESLKSLKSLESLESLETNQKSQRELADDNVTIFHISEIINDIDILQMHIDNVSKKESINSK